MKSLPVCIGYDPKEAVAFHVAVHSIMSRASGPVEIVPINLANMRHIYTRPRDPGQSTEFTYARFLAPYLCDWEMCIFMDSDVLVLCDVWELAELAKKNSYVDVMCVKHNYQPRPGNKFMNQSQSSYPCKNWSSIMVFNGHRSNVRRLTPDFVNKSSPMDLHQFKWATDVGDLPPEYNHLVGEYEPNPNAKIVHYTLGAPCFRSYQQCEYAAEWFEELGRMTHCDDPILELHDANVPRHGNKNPDGLSKPD